MRRFGQQQVRMRGVRFESLECRLLLTTLVDLDGDGDLDVLRQSRWYENFDGQGNFVGQDIGNGDISHSVLADLNNDDQPDIVSSEPRWFENNGTKENFAVDHVFEGAKTSERIEVIDLYGNGSDDILFFDDGDVSLFENSDGLGAMKLVYSGGVPDQTDAADIDHDGDLDFLVLRELPDQRRLTIVQVNRGDNSFDEKVIFEDFKANHELGLVFNPWWDPQTDGAELRDIDGDGFVDIVRSSYLLHGNSRSYEWYRNDAGSGEFEEPKPLPFAGFLRHSYTDINSDGYVDIFYSDHFSCGTDWILNDGTGKFASHDKTPFPDCSGSFDVVDIGDINGDGVFDFMTTSTEDGVPLWTDGVTATPHVNQAPPIPLQPGDANQDYFFDEADLIQVAKAGRFENGAASWNQGDWDAAPGGAPLNPPTGNGRFDAADLDAAVESNKYRVGAYSHDALAPYSETRPMRLGLGDADLVLSYKPSTGELHVTNHGGPLSAFQLQSHAGQLITDEITGFDGRFDFATPESIFTFDLTGSTPIDLGAILPSGLDWADVFYDLQIDGARLEGGSLGDVQFTCSDCDLDVETFYEAIRSERLSVHRDLNRDAILDASDLRILLQETLGSSIGDSNLDGKFDSSDFVHVFKLGHYDDDVIGNSNWTHGDWNVDGEFDSSDLVWAFQVGDFETAGGNETPPVIGDVSFNLQTIRSASSIGDVIAADMDSDGDLDLVTVGRYIAWYENLGRGIFGNPNHLGRFDGSVGWRANGVVVDLDGDKDLDIVAASNSFDENADNETIWIENLGGARDFSEKRTVDEIGDLLLTTADLDGDGDSDLISTSPTRWFENTGDGENLVRRRTFNSGLSGHLESIPFDFDNDGDLDLLFSGYTEGELWENTDGNGNFQRKDTIDGSLFAVGDIDNDSDIDIVARYQHFTIPPSTGFVVYRNVDGNGTFEISEQTFEFPHLWNLEIVDVDNDGDNDVITGRRPTRGVDGEGILWAENNGDGTFDRSHIIHSGVASFLTSEDLDQDGDVDVIVSAEGSLKWVENRDGKGTFAGETVVEFSLGRDVEFADIDQDDDVDIVLNPYSKLTNLFGESGFVVEQIPGFGRHFAFTSNLIDVDSDNDLDFVSSNSEFGLVWYENAYGEGNFAAERIIDTDRFALWLAGGDLDTDGDQDVVALTTSTLAWHHNVNGRGHFLQKTLIQSDESGSFTDAQLIDFDADNDLDILVASGRGAYFLENNGGEFTQPVEIVAEEVREISTLDFNSDGDFDVLLVMPDSVVVIESTDGRASFDKRTTISNRRDLVMVTPVDMDLDGDQDILSYSRLDNRILWLENIDRTPNFVEREISSLDVEVSRIDVVDFDNDRDDDVVVRSIDGEIIWYENRAITNIR